MTSEVQRGQFTLSGKHSCRQAKPGDPARAGQDRSPNSSAGSPLMPRLSHDLCGGAISGACGNSVVVLTLSSVKRKAATRSSWDCAGDASETRDRAGA